MPLNKLPLIFNEKHIIQTLPIILVISKSYFPQTIASHLCVPIHRLQENLGAMSKFGVAEM